MELKNIKDVNLNEVFDTLEKELFIGDLKIKSWKNKQNRVSGIADIQSPLETHLEGILLEAKRMVDRDCLPCVEVIDIEDDVIYFYDGKLEQILVF